MNISTKGRYGLLIMLDLAANYNDKPITLVQVAQRQGLSSGYLEQLIVPLKRAGLVQSVRGAQGGYILSFPPDQILVGDIYRALEGPIAPAACVREVDPEPCGRSATCVTRKIWAEVRDKIAEVFDSYTLQNLIDMQAELKKSNNIEQYRLS